MKTYKSALEAQVAAVNAANALANALFPELADLLRTHEDRKIIKSTPYAQFTAKFRPLLDNLHARGLRWSFHGSFVVFWVDGEAQIDKGGSYHSPASHRVEYYANTSPDRGSLYAAFRTPGRCDWTVEEVRGLQVAVEQAREQVRQAERALGPFANRNY